jgi:leucyl/phenylalanyl-tRNA--protein transferase
MPPRPLYRLSRELVFPPVELAHPDGLLAIGGNLSVERLLLAYQSGIFPWYSEDAPIMWWSPPERSVIEPSKLHVGRSLRKVLVRGQYTVRFDTAFPQVIAACASVPRSGAGNGTWIVPEMMAAYIALHEAGFAHSVESYDKDGVLVGGLYGVSLGGCFFGESMFSYADDASKVAFVTLADRLTQWEFDLIDGQLQNAHLARFGLTLIPRAQFLLQLRDSLRRPTRRGAWT